MEKTLYFASLFFLCFWAKAQENKPYNYIVPESKIADSDHTIEVNKKGDTVFIAHYKGQDLINRSNQDFVRTYKGTPFFKNGWYRGKVQTGTGMEWEFVMAYNIQKEEVYLSNNPNMEATVMRPVSFTMAGHTFRQYKNQYYEVIYEGGSQIWKEYGCTLVFSKSGQRTGYEAEGGVNEYDGEFVKTVKYYLKEGDKLREIPSKNRLFKLFGAKSNDVKNYAKTKGLNLSKETNLVSLFRYYDSL
ncbi:hypothetical protein GVN20_06710 [Runella sp. CRIBMP]|uniref:hypothetical protein n=1 Tax=Runella sp. CRIBMP TaxID=2683261 RepID=UPI001412F3DF|nr:hypothetical protein [Runella sp. CRIBMP]NBB19041.1 hypothetical protein [Runella sp. CRIBMP]